MKARTTAIILNFPSRIPPVERIINTDTLHGFECRCSKCRADMLVRDENRMMIDWLNKEWEA